MERLKYRCHPMGIWSSVMTPPISHVSKTLRLFVQAAGIFVHIPNSSTEMPDGIIRSVIPLVHWVFAIVVRPTLERVISQYRIHTFNRPCSAALRLKTAFLGPPNQTALLAMVVTKHKDRPYAAVRIRLAEMEWSIIPKKHAMMGTTTIRIAV